MAISSPENSCGERTSTSLWLPAPSASRASSRRARMGASCVVTVKVTGAEPRTVLRRHVEAHGVVARHVLRGRPVLRDPLLAGPVHQHDLVVPVVLEVPVGV